VLWVALCHHDDERLKTIVSAHLSSFNTASVPSWKNMDIYENIVIGNFLYGLGVAMGSRTNNMNTAPIAVNLFQQTPLDKPVGDLLVSGTCVMRILEFKRERNDSPKEESKLIKLETSIAALKNPEMKELSRKVHWFLSTSMKGEFFNIRIVPYLDQRLKTNSGPKMLEFINSIVDEVLNSKTDKTVEFSRYLELVANSQGSPVGSSGGLITAINPNGEIRYIIVEDLRELDLTLKKVHGLYLQRQANFEALLEKERSLMYERSNDIGMSL
jgi:hypothetical protein